VKIKFLLLSELNLPKSGIIELIESE